MRRIVIGISVGLLVSVLTCTAVWAQATAQISGSVKNHAVRIEVCLLTLGGESL